MDNKGKAYGFLKCWMPLANINSLVLQARQEAAVSSGLELQVIEGIYKANCGFLLAGTVIQRLLMDGSCNYVIEGELDGSDNKGVAEELVKLAAKMHESPLFEPKSQRLHKVIVYERDWKYERLD